MDQVSRPEWEFYGRSIRGEGVAIGERFDRFTVLEVISISIFGILYRAKDMRRKGAERLLHVFPRALSNHGELQEGVERMIRLLEKATIPHILRPEEWIQSDDQSAIVYENAPGVTTLTRHMAEAHSGRGIPPDQVAENLENLGNSLKVCADLGLHHLSITPDMVLIAPGSGNVLLYGVGLMERMDRRRFEIFVSSAIVPIRSEGEIPGYSNLDVLSPELRNDESFDTRADVYALGILGYYMLTHLRPVANWTHPSKVDSRVAEGWDFFISRCLEAEPEDRYPTIGSMVADLEDVDTLGQVTVDNRGKFIRKLDRIPLPEGIRKKYSQNVQTYLRLAVLGIIGTLAVGTASLFYLLIFQDALFHEEQTLFEVEPGETANLILKFDTRRVKVRVVDGDRRRFIVDDGELRLRGSFRDYIFQIEAPQYEPHRMSMRLNGTLQTKEVILDVAWGKLRIDGPAGARIEVIHQDGRRFLLGEIPESGRWEAEDRLLEQEYDIQVAQDGYRTETFDGVKLRSDKWTELEATLKPLPASLRVVTEPEGIAVRVDGEDVGTTPLSYDDIPSTGTVEVEVSGGGFRTRMQTIEILPGQENVIDFGNLESMTGTLELAVQLRGRAPTAEELSELTVQLAEEDYMKVARLNRGLPAGVYSLSAQHPDYYPEQRSVRVEDEVKHEEVVNLQPRPGKIEMILPDRPFRALVDGEPAIMRENIIAIPAETEVEVTLYVKDFLVERRRFYHEANTIERWEPTLTPIPGPSEAFDWTLPYINEKFVWIARGQFTMGSPLEEQLRLPNEGPSTRVRMTQGYWIGETEVTQAFYQRVMEINPSEDPSPRKPVTQVTWDEAMAFAVKLTELEAAANRLPEGYVYRLPTEAEWEFAARAGTTTPFSFGATATPVNGNFEGQYPRDYSSTEIASDGAYGTEPVKQYPPNAWGLYDVHGNVAEWVYDAFNDRLWGGDVSNPVRLEGARGRGVRGGAWDDYAHAVRSAARDYSTVQTRRADLGFRIVLAPVLSDSQ